MGRTVLIRGAELLKHEEKNKLRQSTFSKSDEWILAW